MSLRRVLMGTALTCLLAWPLATLAQPASPGPASGDHAAFNGFWGSGFEGGLGGPGGGAADTSKEVAVAAPVRNGDISNLTNDGVIARRSGDNLPLYKPQFWDKVLDLDWNGNKLDPFNSCKPAQPPRLGPPRRIMVTPTEIFLFYAINFQRNDFRIVPIGKRNHPIDRDGTWLGDPVARWDGDDLVIETEGFNAESWIHAQGYLHGYEMKVTERFHMTPEGLVWQATVEDPEYLQKPWVMDPMRMRHLTGDNLYLEEAPPCADHDNANLVGKQREM